MKYIKLYEQFRVSETMQFAVLKHASDAAKREEERRRDEKEKDAADKLSKSDDTQKHSHKGEMSPEMAQVQEEPEMVEVEGETPEEAQGESPEEQVEGEESPL